MHNQKQDFKMPPIATCLQKQQRLILQLSKVRTKAKLVGNGWRVNSRCCGWKQWRAQAPGCSGRCPTAPPSCLSILIFDWRPPLYRNMEDTRGHRRVYPPPCVPLEERGIDCTITYKIPCVRLQGDVVITINVLFRRNKDSVEVEVEITFWEQALLHQHSSPTIVAIWCY